MKYVAAAFPFMMASIAAAQSISGATALSAQCGPTVGVPFVAGGGTGSTHGACTGSGGTTSANDATVDWMLSRGDWRVLNAATVDYRGANSWGEAQGAAIIEADDLVFRDTANPNNRQFVRTTLNFLIGVTQQHVGASNCSQFLPNLYSAFSVTVERCRAEGTRTWLLSSGDGASGVITIADPVDGTLVPHATNSEFVQLTVPTRFRLQIDNATSTGYCAQPPAPFELGVARSGLRFVFPCDRVFDLPPGITVNSAQLGIVDNRWTLGGPLCCPADFNGDSFLDFFDYLDYVTCFETGACPPGTDADFNGDGFADFFDYADFVAAFEAGC